MVNLVLALVWLLLGIGAILWSMIDPERNARMTGLNLTYLSIGAFVLCLYNLVRWWFTRSRRGMTWPSRFPPRKPPRVLEYDPNLDFSRPEAKEAPKDEKFQTGPPPPEAGSPIRRDDGPVG
jgi:hypothetical protein